MARSRNRSVLLVAGILAVLACAIPASAAAAIPALKFEKHQPKTALLGTAQPVELFAENPEGQPRGYNLSFRDVLPEGVSYVANSASPAPSAIIADKPVKGQTTLIFENVSDLSPKSSFAVNFEVEPSHTFFKISGKKTYKDEAQAFISEKARKKPNFSKTTGLWLETAAEKAVIAKTESSATTELTAIKIEKSEPSPEGEILRGLHEHQTVYTLTVKNNHIGPTEGLTGQGPGKTKSIIVEDWLPAGLEFLGCGETDNTKNTTTNPGSAEEYPGSGKIDPGHAPTLENCVEPFYVKTEAEVQPPGSKMPKGTYTHVKWEGPETLATSGEFKIQYVAAIPLLKNTANWLGTEPAAEAAPEGGRAKQIANLNNNSGAETVDEEALKNNAQARGKYEAIEVKDNFELERTGEDLAIQKGTNPTQTAIFDGAETNWTLKLETSEYRRSEPVSITDQLPDGLCPIGPRNYEEPIELKSECAASATRHPTVKYLKGGPVGRVGKEEQIEYSRYKEEASGGFKLQFLAPEVEALSRLEPSQELLITFPTTTRVFYQENFKDDKPVLTGDSWKNEVTTEAPSFTRCYVGKTPGPYEADPNCEKPGTNPIVQITGGRAEGANVTDVSEASQKAGSIKIRKTVRENLKAEAPGKCEDPSSHYVKGLLSEEAALPKYRPGDEICWRLVVEFPNNIYAGNPVVTDFIPADQELVQESEVEGPANNVAYIFEEGAAKKEELLEWKLGKAESVESNKTFEVRFRTKVTSLATSEPGEISGNLMKVSYSNSKGVTFPLRDRSEVVREEPNLELKKSVLSVNGGAASTNVKGGDEVKFGIKLPNTKGTLKAEEIEVWDNLPTGIECGVQVPVAKISPAGECVKVKEGEKELERIVWKNLSVAAGATGELTYVVSIPTNYAPSHAFTNTAGVTEYKSETDTGAKFTYVPEENIKPNVTPNAGKAKESATVTTTAASVVKTATTETTQAGNTSEQATIGETVKYTATAKIPANSVLYETATLRDEIPVGLELLTPAGQAKVKLTIGASSEESPAGFSVTEIKEGEKVFLQLSFPETFTVGSTEAEVALTFKAKVRNIPTNFQGVVIENKAKLTYHDKEKASRSAETKEATKTPLVEPQLVVTKKQSIEPSEEVKPGDRITYTVGAEDVAGRSTANNVVLVDTVPVGMKIVSTEGGIYDQVARTITWSLPVVEPGTLKTANTRKYTLEVENPARAASVFNNKVTGTTQSMPTGEGPGRTAANNQGSTAYESSATKSSHLVGASISKTVEPTEGTIGTPLRYTLTMNLPPSIEYFNTTVVDTLPEGVAFDKTLETKVVETEGGPTTPNAASELTAAPEGTPQRFGWYFGNLAPSTHSRELIVVFEGHVKAKTTAGVEIKKGAELTNSVTGLYNGEDKGKPTKVPTPGAGSGFVQQTQPATAKTTVNEPSLSIAKSVKVEPGGGAGPEVQPGESFVYKLVVTNSSSWPAYNALVTDTNPQADLRGLTPVNTPAGVKVLTTNPLSWEIAEVPKEGSVTLEYTAKLAPSEELKKGDKIDNTAAISSFFGVPKEARQPSVEYREYKGNESSVGLTVALPQLVLTKTAGPKEAPSAGALIGEEFQWNLKVDNTSGKATAKGVDLLDKLPAGWKYVKGSAQLAKATYPDPVATHTSPGEEEELRWENVADLGPVGSGTNSVTLTFKAVPTTELVNKEETFTNNAVATGEDAAGKTKSLEGPYESKSSAQATLQTPPLKIEKTPDEGDPGAKAIAGKTSSYTIAVKNTGKAKATEVKVTDVLDHGNVYTPGPGTGATASPSTGFGEVGSPQHSGPAGEENTEVTWAIAEIAPESTVTITVPVSVEAAVANGAKLHDVASVVSRQQPVASEDKGTLEVSREADLEIVKTQISGQAVPGENVEYKLHIKNNGPSDAETVAISDPIPAGTDFVSADARCSLVGAEVLCPIGAMKAGEEKDYKVTLKVQSSRTASVVNKAKVTTATKEPEGGGQPNEAEVTTPVKPQANLSIVKRGPAQPVLLGSTFEYELEVTNKGPSDAVGVVVTDPLPEQVELVEAAAPCEEGEPGEVECALGAIVAGAEPTKLHFKVKAIGIPVEGANVANTAEVGSQTEDPEPADNESTAETTVLPAADLAITKTAPAAVEPDGELTYKLHVENLGPSIAHKVTVTDPLPVGIDFVSASEGCANAAGVVTCTVQPAGELAVGATADFQVVVHVPNSFGGQPLVNTATVKGEEGDPNSGNDSSTVTTTVGPAADLSIAKTMGKAEAGKPLTYTLAVTNKGPSASSAVTVKDTLPAGTTFSSAAPSQGTCSAAGQEVTCLLGPLAAGGSAQVSITVDVGATVTGTLRNTAKVEGPEFDPEKGNNESSVEGPVTPLPPSAPPAPKAPNLKVVKTASTSAPQVGTPFDYAVTVSNMGGAEAKNVKVVDTLNGPVKVVSIDTDSGKCDANGSKIDCTIPSIAVGKTVHITYTVIAEAAGALSNTVSAQASNGEKAPANNHAVKSVKAKAGKAAAGAKASFTLTKTAAKKVVRGGKKVAFTITLRNGPTALVDAAICDRLPAALVFVKAAGASFVNGEACWQKKYVGAHKVLRLHLVARAVRGFKPRKARNVASASAENAPGSKRASATVRIKPAFAGAPGGVTG